MAGTVRHLVALVATITFATAFVSDRSISSEPVQAEPDEELNGKKLFEKETFGGNGRTCRTCHAKDSGTLTLVDVQQIIDKADPDDPFLVHDALDEDGVGTTRVQAHATIRFSIPLPPWISMADDPGATHVTVFRGIPSTRNTPALDRVLLHDGRAATLQEQALAAIHDHSQNTVEPTTAQLDAIAEFERRDAHFFSSDALKQFAAGGPPPELPPGITPAEQRGRTFLVDAPFAPPSKNGICALCHSGPMLNMSNQAHSDVPGGRPPVGARFFNTGVTLVNQPGNPIRTWVIDDRINPAVTVRSPDLGCSSARASDSAAVGSATGVPCGVVQDSDAVGRQGHCAVLPRQRGQDAARRCRALSAVLQLHRRTGSGRFANAGRFHRAHRQGCRRYRRVPETAEVRRKDN